MSPRQVTQTVGPEVFEVRSALLADGTIQHVVHYREVTRDAGGAIIAQTGELKDVLDGDIVAGQKQAMDVTLRAALAAWEKRRYG